MPPAKRGARGRVSPLVRHGRHRGTRYPPPFPVLPPPTAPLLLPCGVPSPPASPLCLLPPPNWVGEVTPGNRAWNAQQITFSAPVGEGSAGGNPPHPASQPLIPSPAPGLGVSSSLPSFVCVEPHSEEPELHQAEQQPMDRYKLGGSSPLGEMALLGLWSSKGGVLAAMPEAPNSEGADPCVSVNPDRLASSQQQPVANRTPSAPCPLPASSAQMSVCFS